MAALPQTDFSGQLKMNPFQIPGQTAKLIHIASIWSLHICPAISSKCMNYKYCHFLGQKDHE